MEPHSCSGGPIIGAGPPAGAVHGPDGRTPVTGWCCKAFQIYLDDADKHRAFRRPSCARREE
jgi:hypothetical protein